MIKKKKNLIMALQSSLNLWHHMRSSSYFLFQGEEKKTENLMHICHIMAPVCHFQAFFCSLKHSRTRERQKYSQPRKKQQQHKYTFACSLIGEASFRRLWQAIWVAQLHEVSTTHICGKLQLQPFYFTTMVTQHISAAAALRNELKLV